ncbi:AAA family ATPase [Arthrospira platensis NCB002]|uniref:Endonuclease GajA/Old nuclease/RecF-like AAA domain-containing protein n=1 Tax=Limnospira platensis NIES-46 TaxID=1236695 RepID=A0A5M3TDS5_LIMPL|nr:AAA family ATPase [Arthrospira platensis]MDF2211459.1 AAA family ATPase [Arthrospira platensis NCB002]BAI88503.1 hypothetical protein NIES39_A06650 [Arthrospira platensis NIES-39]BDT10910.1 hypothetical protein N39L_06330 [Arthrospira platensis NIES-39]GCE96108.1 hypothetical protein NIES46_41750 [Arthrospira platensis NIES-46]
MQINQLTLTNFRGFEQAEFEFKSGMNLLVGINGVGKSTILDVIRIMLSQVLPDITLSRNKRDSFNREEDIQIGRDSFSAELRFDASGIAFKYLVFEQLEKYAENTSQESAIELLKDRRRRIQERRSANEPYNLQFRHDLTPKTISKEIKNAVEQPLALYFSTTRSSIVKANISKQKTAGGQRFAFAQALNSRQLNIGEFADWMLTQHSVSISDNNVLAKRHLELLQNAIPYFLENCMNFRAVSQSGKHRISTLKVDKYGSQFDIHQLSDGERGILVLVLDIARRLIVANPKLEDPLREGKAVILIDELDLHLHPRWQRMVVHKLTEIFPNCQFIATTHSPQMIGEVEPENIIILDQDKQPYIPDQSLGMDSNWILRFLMETPERDINTQKTLEKIESLIKQRNFPEATEQINSLRELGNFPELVRLQTRIDRIRLLGK